jgi:hypothetical protein
LFFNCYFYFCFAVLSLFLSLFHMLVDMFSVWLVLRLYSNTLSSVQVISRWMISWKGRRRKR